MSYLIKKDLILERYNPNEIDNYYNLGYIAGRKANGYIYQTRSLRINLNNFSPNSENRRILRKTNLDIRIINLPFAIDNYDWKIHKLGKTFYSTKFPDAKFSAAKIKFMLTAEFHFNILYNFILNNQNVGYVICLETDNLIHYCYPFYEIELDKNLGMQMMLQIIINAQLLGKEFIYLGGFTRKEDKYKLQFNGLEWFSIETNSWNKNIEELKALL